MANVAQKIVEPGEAALVAQCLHGLRDAAGLDKLLRRLYILMSQYAED